MKKLEEWANENRPGTLALTFLLSLIIGLLIDWFLGGHLYAHIFYPTLDTTAGARAWSSIVYAVIFIFGLPSAFLLWLWRDRNVRDQLVEKKNEVENQRVQLEVLKLQVEVQGRQVEHQARQLELQSEQIANQRKDISLKEFQEVRKIAAGLFDIEGSDSAKVQLQIAAMHQLRGFLRDEYPETFRRAAFELLLAGHTAAVVSGLEINEPDTGTFWSIYNYFERNHDTVTLERAKILRDEAERILEIGFPLQGRRFDFLDFSKVNIKQKILSGTSFIGTDLRSSDLSFCQLSSANFSSAYLAKCNLTSIRAYSAKFNGALLREASLRDAELSWSEFENADLEKADLGGAKCSRVKFIGTDLQEANLEGTILNFANFQGAKFFGLSFNEDTKFDGSIFDDNTEFAKGWIHLSDNAKSDYRTRWRDKGMKHVDDTNDSEDDVPF